MSIPHHSLHALALTRLKGAGVSNKDIADELGLTPGAVTQLAAKPEVAAAISELQETSLAASTAIDAKYDRIEDKLLDQLEKTIPLLMRPMEISKVLQTVNGAKRRGAGHKATEDGPARVLNLNIPIALQTKFVVNSANQVVEAGAQTLVTMPSSNIAKMAEVHNVITHQPQSAEDEFGLS
jgi:predicted transcriptional regulator